MLPMGIYFNCVYELLMQFILFLTRKNLECVHKLTNETRNERTNYTNETQTNGKRTNDTCKQKRYEISINDPGSVCMLKQGQITLDIEITGSSALL